MENPSIEMPLSGTANIATEWALGMSRVLPSMRSWFQRAFVALLVAQVLLMIVASASPGLHRWLHADADSDQHECGITLFVHGGVDNAAGPATLLVFAFLPIFCSLAIHLTPVWVKSLFLEGSQLEHAPPSGVAH